MLRHKNIDRVCCIVLVLTLMVSILFVGGVATGAITGKTTMGYENRLFDQSRVHTIDIVMDDWEAFLDTATSEEYVACHLVIDGESYKNVAIRGKGNTSLSSVAGYGNDRYSFKVEFDHYQTGSTYHGLDKLSLNNLIYDNTYMKDYFAYTLMNKMGVAAPLCSFVQVNVNGEPWGLYLAVEGVEEAFLQRNYGKGYGELYKPDSMSFGGGRGNGGGFDMSEIMEQFSSFFNGGEEGENRSFAMPGMQMPGGFDPSQWGGFGGSREENGNAWGWPAGGDMPDMGDMPAIPNSGTTPDRGSMPAIPDNGTISDRGGIPTMPNGGMMPAGSGMPAMPNGGITPDRGSMPAMSDNGTTPDESNPPSRPGGFDQMQRGGGMGGGFGMGSSDVKLQYIDDDPSSYANILNNAKTDITEADQTRLIASLKALSEGDVSVVDTDAVIRYMAVHNFLCNDDSYTGRMVHNYYLYEEDGVLSMIPWDYNLAYGTMNGGGNASSAVNTDIDRLVNMGSSGDRPMADWITTSDEYTAQYHAVYQEFIASFFDSSWFTDEIDRVTAMISPYVQNDPTAFCTYEEFLTGAETLKQFCLRRAQSVTNQLHGDSTPVDAADLNLSDLGTMHNGRGGWGGFGQSGEGSGRSGSTERERTFPAMPTGGETGQMPAMPTGGMSDRMPAIPSQETNSEFPTMPTTNGNDEARSQRASGLMEASPATSGESRFNRSRFGFDTVGMTRQSGSADGCLCLLACAALLCGALIFAKCYRSNR